MFVSYPRHVFGSASCPYLVSFLKESGSSCFRGSDGCSGQKSVWMTHRASLFARSIQCFSSTVMVIMSSMNPSIDASVAVMSTAKESTVVRELVGCCLSSCGSKDWCGQLRSSVSQDSSRSRLFPRSIVASLTAVYSAGAGVAPKINHRQIRDSLSNICMHVDSVVVFACIRR